MHPDCVRAVEDAVTLLRELGHELVEAKPPFSREKMVRAYFLTVAANVARDVEHTARRRGRRPQHQDFEPATWLFALMGWKTSAPELLEVQEVMHQTARDVAEFFQKYDLFLCSTLARPPARVGELAVNYAERLALGALRNLPLRSLLNLALEVMAQNKLVWTPNTQLFNQTGQPAMSVPLFFNPQGLPIGVQFAARFGDEATLFQLASQLERARPWADRVSPLVK
jgi:amidase